MITSKYDNTKNSVEYREDNFIAKLKIIQPDLSYLEGYESITSKVKVENKYGVCCCFANRLLDGAVPCIRSAINPDNYIVNQLKEVHGDLYDYSEVEYVNTKTKIKIICKEHGVFKQRPSHHLKGQGCKKCNLKTAGGFYEKPENFNRESNMYILKFSGNNETFFKFGISVDVSNRVTRIEKEVSSIYKIEIIKVKTNSVKYCYELEKKFKRHIKYKNFQYVPKIYFQGISECFNRN